MLDSLLAFLAGAAHGVWPQFAPDSALEKETSGPAVSGVPEQSRLGGIAAGAAILIGLAVSTPSLGAATYYASPSGSTGNTGSSASSPWTLAYALSRAVSYDTIILLSGTYSGEVDIGKSYLTLRSQVKWGAKFTGSGGPGLATWPADTVHDVTFDGLEVTGAVGPGFCLYGANTTIQNCWIHGNGTMGIESHKKQGHLIQNNLIEKNGTHINLDHGIYFSGTNHTIRGNVIRNNFAWGVQFYEDGGNAVNCWIYGNLIYNNGTSGASRGTYADGIVIYGTSGATNYVFNNTIIATNYAAIDARYCYMAVTNNIILGGNLMDAGGATFRCDYNLSASALAFTGPHDIVSRTANFVNTARGLYWLASTSPCRNVAQALKLPVDFFGTANVTVTDVGAFQFNTSYAADTRLLDPTSTTEDYWQVLGTVTPPAAGIGVSPTSRNFGSIAVGSTADLAFTVQNTGSGTLSGAASVSAPFSIVSGGSYSLTAGQTQTVTVRYSPTVAGSANQSVTFTGPSNVVASVSGVSTNASLPPTVSAIAQNTGDVDPVATGLQVYAGSAVQYSASATDPAGGTVSWQWSYSANGGAEVVVSSGSGTAPSVAFTYAAGDAGKTYLWKLRATTAGGTAQSTLSVGVVAMPVVSDQLTFSASAGNITAPFAVINGSLYQTTITDAVTGGSAVYTFTIAADGAYVIQASVNAPNTSQNSFFVNIDAQPEDPTMIWDIPITVGFESRLISWRGNGTDGSNQFVPAVFRLTKGTHQLVIRGREANVMLQSFSILQTPPPPVALRVSAEG